MIEGLVDLDQLPLKVPLLLIRVMIEKNTHKTGNANLQEAVKEKLCLNRPFLRKAYKKATLVKLHEDHVNACMLLDILDEQLAELKSRGKPDYLLIRDIIKYMVDYPDIVHHPLEEILFNKLEQINVESHDSIRQLCQEHKELAFTGDELNNELEKVAGGSIVEKDRVYQLCSKYRDLLISHMKLEEEEIFPKIERLFGISDWSDIQSSLEAIEDPLFGEAVQDYYQELYDRIRSEINNND